MRDRGPGFDPDARPRRPRGVRESIVGRMQRHGGEAVIHSVPGEGTEVELRLAGHERRAPQRRHRRRPPAFRAGVRAELDGLVEVLGDAATVEDAVRCIAELEPDVVLLDVQMPGGGGVR